MRARLRCAILRAMNTIRRVLGLLAADAAILALSLYLAFLIKHDYPLTSLEFVNFRRVLPALIVLRLTINYFLGLYRWPFRYASLHEAYSALRAVALGSVGFALTVWALRLDTLARSVVVSEFLSSLVLMTGYRFAPRAFFSLRKRRRKQGKPTLILGAGDAAEHLVREIFRADQAANLPVAFVDDDPLKQKMKLHGVPVAGTTDDISRIVREGGIEEIIFAMPSVSGERRREIIAKCETVHLPIKTLPFVKEKGVGEAGCADLRRIRLEDLLAGEEVRLDTPSVSGLIEEKKVLVTGAAGSIGSELCRQILDFKPSRLIMLDHNENHLCFLERELAGRGANICAIVGSVRDSEKMSALFGRYRPQVVFHAAAHKHASLMELDPGEAVKNNVIGTKILAEQCEPFKVEKFVLISTNNAVNPTSVMGCSKRIAEMVVQHFGRKGETRFCAVRFGNVLGSEGSVVPLFLSQIERGGPVTVTHPEMKRFFVLIRDAARLILQTAAMGESGKTYVLRMGEQVKIDLLARDLISLYGLQPDRDMKVEYVGLREGEELRERLVGEDESLIETAFEHIRIVEPEKAGGNVVEQVAVLLELISNAAVRAEVINTMKMIVPSYRSARRES